MSIRDVFKEMRKSVEEQFSTKDKKESTSEVYTDTFSKAINDMIDEDYEKNLKKEIMQNVQQEDLHQDFLERIEKTKNETIKAMTHEK